MPSNAFGKICCSSLFRRRTNSSASTSTTIHSSGTRPDCVSTTQMTCIRVICPTEGFALPRRDVSTWTRGRSGQSGSGPCARTVADRLRYSAITSPCRRQFCRWPETPNWPTRAWRSCVGCHEHTADVPAAGSSLPLATQHRPSEPQPGDKFAARVIHCPSDVRPIPDKYCMRCHAGEESSPGSMPMRSAAAHTTAGRMYGIRIVPIFAGFRRSPKR